MRHIIICIIILQALDKKCKVQLCKSSRKAQLINMHRWHGIHDNTDLSHDSLAHSRKGFKCVMIAFNSIALVNTILLYIIEYM